MKIEVQGLVKKFKSVRALDGVSLAVEPGRIIALLGANGAGKTTLLRCLAGIVSPDEGEVRYDGERLVRARLDLRRHFQFLPDFPAVFESWSPLRHIGMLLRLYEIDPAPAGERVVELLRDFDLLPLAEAPLATLSRGQRYKAVLTGLLAVDPEVWLLDEPFASGMDPHGINAFKRHARAAVARGTTVVYSTQILDAAVRFSDHVCVIHRGQVRAFTATSELQQSANAHETGLDEIFNQLREEEVA